MESPYRVLPGLQRIFFFPAIHAPRFARETAACGVRSLVACDLTEIPLAPKATASESVKFGTNGPEESVTLSFRTAHVTIPDRSAFVIVDADDESYLIGSREEPWPIVEITTDLSTPSEGKAGVSVEVSFPGRLIPCIVCSPSF